MKKTALITGASSGIGREIALLLDKKGYRVILVARRKDRLEEIASKVKNSRIIVSDLSGEEEVYALYEKVKEEKISVLINGAGFGLMGEFTETSLERETEMINVNIRCVHILTKLFLKDFVKENHGYILNIASAAGLLPGGPGLDTYYATKAYVASLTQGIFEELKQKKSKVKISALCPGPVDTEFNKVAGVKFAAKGISPEFCARVALEGLFSGKMIVVPGKFTTFLTAASKIIPRKIVLWVTAKFQKKKIS